MVIKHQILTRAGLALLLLAAANGAVFYTLRQFSQLIDERARARRLSLELQDLQVLMLDAETGQRGYLLTGQPDYLDPYTRAKDRVNPQLDRVAGLARDLPAFHMDLDVLRPLVQAKMAELGQSVALAQAQGVAAAVRKLEDNEGREIMVKLRSELADRQDRITDLFDRVTADSARSALRCRWTLAASSALIVGLVGWMLWIGRGEITRRREAELSILSLNQRLEGRMTELDEVNRELESFSYSVSHDLRAPLRHIHGFVNLMKQNGGCELNDKQQRYLGIISEAAHQMGRLIDDLLVFSRMSRTELTATETRLDELVDRAIRELEDELKGRQVVWRRQPLPVVQADPNLLYQAVFNLVANAAKYSRPRTRAVIEIGTAPGAPDEVVVFVRDNGVGFDMRYVDKLFGVFQRLHRAEEFEGTGIGLANVRRIVHRHGGKTWAEGQVDHGATFYFSLPLRPAAGQAASAAGKLPDANAAARHLPSAIPVPLTPVAAAAPTQGSYHASSEAHPAG